MDNVKLIPLNHGYVAICDLADYDLLSEFNWYAFHEGRTPTMYVHGRRPGSRKLYSMHAVVMPGFKKLDHVNRNGLDNRRANLRPCNSSQNRANSKLNKNNKSGYRGVTAWKGTYDHIVYKAEVRGNGALHYLGYFPDPISAAKARDKKALELFGSFAVLNFPEAA